MDRNRIFGIASRQLAVDSNCAPQDFFREGIHFFEARENPGCRAFPRGEEYFSMISMGTGTVVSATPRILEYVRERLSGKSNEDAFSQPFVYSAGLLFLPDPDRLCVPSVPAGISVELLEREEIAPFYRYKELHHALTFEERGNRPDMLAVSAHEGDALVGLACASADCATMWQIGIDILPPYRGRGVASALVGRLTAEILARNIVPYYGTAVWNVASQRVAHRVGYIPAWTCAYRGRFDWAATNPTT